MADTLFLTGRLAMPSLKRTLATIESLDVEYEVRDLGLQVAGLMTASMIERRIGEIDASRIIVPGLCSGDLDRLSTHLGIPVQKGPVDLKDLPEYFGEDARQRSLDNYDIDIFAEIVDAPDLSIDQILQRACYYRDNGANVIDVGCLPGREFRHLEASIACLKDNGFQVSIDSLEPDELVRGARAGADYLLSLKESTLWIADQVDATPVLIPESNGDMSSLFRAIDHFEKIGRPYFADAILDPIIFGMTASIIRYAELARRYPQAPIFMGIGNVTELMEAETAGMTAILCGIASELSVKAFLTTEVADHARSVIRQTDLARRIMFAASEDQSLAKGYDSGLLTTHERKPFPASVDEISEMAEQVKDPSFRIQVSDNGIHIYNRDGLHTSDNPFDLFPELDVEEDGSHAFYLGVELARAQIAFELGKRYVQDRPLNWGHAGKNAEFDEASHEYAKPGATLARRKTRRDSQDSEKE